MCRFDEWVKWCLEAAQWPKAVERYRYRVTQDWVNMRWTNQEAQFLFECLKFGGY